MFYFTMTLVFQDFYPLSQVESSWEERSWGFWKCHLLYAFLLSLDNQVAFRLIVKQADIQVYLKPAGLNNVNISQKVES